MKRIQAAAIALTFAACSKDKQTVDTNQTPSQPSGSVVGVVTSLRTAAPLPGITVSVPLPGGLLSATTDSNGAYTLSGVPMGATYRVRFASASYVPRFADADLTQNNAGDYPSNGIAQVNIALAEPNATLTGHVVARDGAPAAGVVIMVDLRDLGFDLVATATTDAQGQYSLTGLPGAPTGLPIQVVTEPWDSNGDGLADFNSLSRTVSTYPGTASLLDLDLRYAAAELLLVTSNVESGTIPANVPIQLTFNRALDATLTTVSLYDSTAAKYVAVTYSVDSTGKILTITPAPGGTTTLAAYHSYSLVVNAVATNGDTLYISRSFTADMPATLLAVTGLTVNPTSADYDTYSFSLSWNATSGASGYQVWVRDTSRNPDYLLVATPGTSTTPSTTVTLPGTFDYYSADGKQTPFAYGVGVDFTVVAVNAAGDAPLPTSTTPIHRSDTVKPTATIVQSGSADNSASATSRTITLTLNFSEYMDPSVVPSIALSNSLTGTWTWNANLTSGKFSIVIPASTNAAGATYTITGAKDTSGNTMTSRSGTLNASTQLVTNGTFETGTLSGWTESYTYSYYDPFVTSSVAATGTYSAQLGNPGSSVYYYSGYSEIYQTLTLPTWASSIVASVAYRPYTNYASYGHDWSACYIQSSSGYTTYETLFSTYQNSSSFITPTPVDITYLAGYTIRIFCETYLDGSHISGVNIDDVSILATP